MFQCVPMISQHPSSSPSLLYFGQCQDAEVCNLSRSSVVAYNRSNPSFPCLIHLQATASCLDMLAMLGVVLIAVLLLSSGSAMPSSNPLLYKTTSSKTKTSKLGAWKLIVIALVSCHLIPLGSADTGNKVCPDTVMRDAGYVFACSFSFGTNAFFPSQVQEVDQHVDHQFKLRGAVSTGAHAGTDVYEEEDKNGVLLVSDAGQEEIKDNKLDPLRAHQESK